MPSDPEIAASPLGDLVLRCLTLLLFHLLRKKKVKGLGVIKFPGAGRARELAKKKETKLLRVNCRVTQSLYFTRYQFAAVSEKRIHSREEKKIKFLFKLRYRRLSLSRKLN